MVFVSMSDQANGAENLMLMLADVSNSAIIFLKKVKAGGLQLPDQLPAYFVTEKSMLAGFLGLLQAINPYRHDYIIISTHAYLNAYLGFLKRIGYLKSKLIVRECTSIFLSNSGPKKWSYRMSYYLGYPAVDMIVCQTAEMRRQLLEHLLFLDAQKVITLRNPIDYDRIIALSKLNPGEGEPTEDYICAAGRLIPEKGFSVLIRAFSQITKHYPQLKLIILGEGPERASLGQLIAFYGLQNRVVLKGWVCNPIPYFKRAKACILSSVNEGFPNVLLQMMAVNPFVVATRCADGINDIQGIYKVEINNANALAHVLKSALADYVDCDIVPIHSYLQERSPKAYINSVYDHFMGAIPRV
jgi:glycosyltransferase involved in cell wall biosynthesis